MDERVIYCKHAPKKTPFGGCIGCKYESEARKYVVDGICYHCPYFEPEDGWEEKIRKNEERLIGMNGNRNVDKTMRDHWMWYKLTRYEYKCPHCGHVNVRYERCGRVVCSNCGESFYA